MNKLNIQNLPIEIIEDDTKFKEATFLFFSNKQQDIEILKKYYAKYNKKFEPLVYFAKMDEMKSYFNDIDARMRKATSSIYVKKLVKDLAKKIDLKFISQTRAKSIISAIITGIVHDSCFYSYQNIYREKYMDLFENTVSDTDDLKNEFMAILIETFTNIINQVNIGNELSSNKYFLYKNLHGKYLIEKNLDNANSCELQKIKDEIKQCLNMTEEEATIQIKKQEEIEDKILATNFETFSQEILKNPIISKLKSTYDEIDNIKNEAIISTLKPDYPELSNDELLEKWDELLQGFDSKEFKDQMAVFKPDEYKAINAYNDNFKYNDDAKPFGNYGVILNLLLNKFKEWENTNHQFSFLEYIAVIMQIYQYCNFDINNENEDELDIFYNANEILTLLAYCLWCNDENDYILNKFKEIMDSTPKCKDNFLEMRKKQSSNKLGPYDNMVFTFTPDAVYKNQIITSVLLELNNPIISKKVKKIIITSNQGIKINKNLYSVNKEHTQLYDTVSNELLANKQHDFALAFMLSYFDDKINIAPFTAFMKYSVDLLESCHSLSNPDEFVKSILDSNQDFNNDEIVKNLHKINKQIDKVIENIENIDIVELINKDSVICFNLSLLFSGKDSKMYFQFDPIKAIKKYKYRLIWFINTNMTTQNTQFKISLDKLEDNLDLIIRLCTYFYVIDYVDNFEEYMPKDINIINLESNNQLKETNIKLQEKINEQQKIINSFENIKNEFNKKMKIDFEKEINKVSASYKKDISSLRKELLNKDEEIAKLKENETELFKLRETLFKLNQENEIEKPVNVNIKQDLKELLSSKNIFIVGGHTTILDKLKNEYPSLKFIHSVSEVNEISLAKADYVFMFYNFMNHPLYYKIISVLTKNNIQWDYIPFTNFEKTINLIYEVLS